jgi:L-lactate utilization protein LutB
MIDCENLVATMDEAIVRLRAFGENMTGRRMSSYVTYITGRNFSGDMGVRTKAQGPEEEHIVLVGKV